jgi:hypothetical protein
MVRTERERVRKIKNEIRKRDKVKRRMEKGTQREIEGHWCRKRKIAVCTDNPQYEIPKKSRTIRLKP